MKRTSVIAALGLAVIFGASGCARTEYVEIRPNCTPPAQPALPSVGKGELWQALGDSQYRQLERYILQLWSFADEQSAILDAICNRD